MTPRKKKRKGSENLPSCGTGKRFPKRPEAHCVLRRPEARAYGEDTRNEPWNRKAAWKTDVKRKQGEEPLG